MEFGLNNLPWPLLVLLRIVELNDKSRSITPNGFFFKNILKSYFDILCL